MLKFNITEIERQAIAQIVERYAQIVKDVTGRNIDRLSTTMDIAACHCNGCPLDLARLAKAEAFDLTHDVGGIGRHLDRDDDSPTAGQLGDMFLPRYARKDTAAA
jgi:hypothetical protein